MGNLTGSYMKAETQLKKLILDENFTSMQTLVNEEVNLMSILRVAHRELQHSNLLAWLFDPNESHGLDDYFIKEFIKLYYIENEYNDLGSSSSKLSVFDFIMLDFTDIIIKREHKNIDILILSKSNDLCIVIENKIYSKERKGQLKTYREYAESKYSDYKHKIFIYLSLFDQEISKEENEFYVQITYHHVKKLIMQILDAKNIATDKNIYFILKQYTETLKSLMNENELIEKTAIELYNKYRPAFDLVFKYASPWSATHVMHNLEELILNEPSLRSFSSSKSYIRFQPEALYENIDKLKKKGFLKKGDNLKNSWIFLFEFHVKKTYIFFDMKIGQYDDSSCREKVYDLYMKNKKHFNKVSKSKKGLSPSWHLSFQKKIVTTFEFNKYLEGEYSSLDEKIETRFRDLVDNDLPAILKFIV